MMVRKTRGNPQLSHHRPSSSYGAKKCHAFAVSFDRFCHNRSGREDRKCCVRQNLGVGEAIWFRSEPFRNPKTALNYRLYLRDWSRIGFIFSHLQTMRGEKCTPLPPPSLKEPEIVTQITSINPR